MRGSKKITVMTSEGMRASRARGNSRTDWVRVRREAARDPRTVAVNREIGEMLTRKRGRPIRDEQKQAISLRIPQSVLKRWKATGPGWQTRMVERLSAP